MNDSVGLRWTIEDVDPRGFEALRLSAWGAWRVFGPEAGYAIAAVGLPAAEARRRTGALPPTVRWLEVGGQPPAMLDGLVEDDIPWRLDPLRLFPDRWEIGFDPGCVLWAMPRALADWLRARHPQRCLVAEDVRAVYGKFAGDCPREPLNPGIHGIPPGFDLGEAIGGVVDRHTVVLASDADGQGLEIAALSQAAPPAVVALDDVTVCAPFWPQRLELGRCGANFVGLGTRERERYWSGRPAGARIAEHWDRHRSRLYALTGLDRIAA